MITRTILLEPYSDYLLMDIDKVHFGYQLILKGSEHLWGNCLFKAC